MGLPWRTWLPDRAWPAAVPVVNRLATWFNVRALQSLWQRQPVSFMPKKLIKRFVPDTHAIKSNRYLRVFGQLLHDPNLWHLNRRSVSGAFFWGLFWAMIPIPLQMVAAAASAILFRINLPIAVALVWLTNPLTMPPVFYFNYVVGSWLMQKPVSVSDFHADLSWLESVLAQIWGPLLLGSVVCGVVLGALGYVGMRGFWRWHVVHQLKRRQAGRSSNTPSTN
jgi:uncharacterized protein (DUF2062 family)